MPRSTDLHAALQRLNDAAYAALRAAKAAGEDELHNGLRNIAIWSDEQVDAAAPAVSRTADAMHEVAE